MRLWFAVGILAIGLAFWWHNDLTGKAAPDLSLSTASGQNIKLSDERGKVVLLDFWATWCPPCRASLPHLQQASDNEAWADRGLVVLAVNAGESADEVGNFLERNQYTFTVLMDRDGSARSKYHVRGIPTTVIVGRDGTVDKVFVGYGDDSPRMIDEAITKALAQPAN